MIHRRLIHTDVDMNFNIPDLDNKYIDGTGKKVLGEYDEKGLTQSLKSQLCFQMFLFSSSTVKRVSDFAASYS